jgi:hypothetical protein
LNVITHIIEKKRLNGMATSKNARGENTETNYGMDITGKKEKRTPKKK